MRMVVGKMEDSGWVCRRQDGQESVQSSLKGGWYQGGQDWMTSYSGLLAGPPPRPLLIYLPQHRCHPLLKTQVDPSYHLPPSTYFPMSMFLWHFHVHLGQSQNFLKTLRSVYTAARSTSQHLAPGSPVLLCPGHSSPLPSVFQPMVDRGCSPPQPQRCPHTNPRNLCCVALRGEKKPIFRWN